jgi:hypothetical protein
LFTYLKIVHNYFLKRFPPVIGPLHYTVLGLVIFQAVLSNIMEINKEQQISGTLLNHYATWAHIGLGSITFIVALVFVSIELKKRGLAHFYPYVYGDFSRIHAGIKRILNKQFPYLEPRGIPATVEGLGMGALLLTTFSGLLWFILWINNITYAQSIKEFHEYAALLMVTYLIGHGTMGAVHIMKIHYKW